MRKLFILTVASVIVGNTSVGYSCNGGGGGSGGTSTGTAGVSALSTGTGFRTGSGLASSGLSSVQPALTQQLAYQRAMQQRMQRQVLAQQQVAQEQTTQDSGLTRSEKAQQAHEDRLAQREARAAAIAERREAAKARNLVRSRAKTSTDAKQLAVNP